ncbi:MAG: redox-regulated ATPase YchF [Candidatus Eisenbacteria bacterium]|nr:redox-regulated ATPase YchF [Candidatus Eisenbacteria bacterium]
MALELGIVGLPNVGKSTLFNALAETSVACSNYPFCTVDANVGVVAVPDTRLSQLGRLLGPEKLTPASIRFVDIAGLVRGASRGEGLGNKFLASIREVDAIVEVVRCFSDASVSHVDGDLDPSRDLDTIRTELLLADLETAERNRDRKRKDRDRGEKSAGSVVEALEKAAAALDAGTVLRQADLSKAELDLLAEYRFLTAKDRLIVANISESDLGSGERLWVDRLSTAAGEPSWKVIPIAASLEAELVALPETERAEFLEGMGLRERGLDRLVGAGYRLLGLVTFYTIKGTETRAWSVVEGTSVSEAAGKIHSDMEKGFIRAEVVSYDDLVGTGSMHAARESGHLRTEGRDYVVREGDVVLVHFH